MALKENILVELRKPDNYKCIRALEDLHNKRPYTMNDWLKINHPQLSTVYSVTIIAHFLNLTFDEVVIPKPELLSSFQD